MQNWLLPAAFASLIFVFLLFPSGRVPSPRWRILLWVAIGVTTAAINDLIARATSAGATAAKVCGAGGGGCLFCYGPPRARTAMAESLAAGGARLLDFEIETEGLRLG